MKMDSNSTYFVDDNFDEKNQESQASEAKSTVVLLSCLLGFLALILAVIIFYFYRRYKADKESQETENRAWFFIAEFEMLSFSSHSIFASLLISLNLFH